MAELAAYADYMRTYTYATGVYSRHTPHITSVVWSRPPSGGLRFSSSMRAYVYIDGFNLYHRLLTKTSYKWLDLCALCKRCLPNDTVLKVRYFTAPVQSRPNDPGQHQRQQVYFQALGTLPELEIHLGSFLSNVITMPLTNPPATGSRFVKVIKTEEKGADVNLASYLFLDGFRGAYDVAVVISDDSDLVEPIRVVRHELNLKVGVINPCPSVDPSTGRKRVSRELRKVSSFYRHIGPTHLPNCLLPDTILDRDGGTITKPSTW